MTKLDNPVKMAVFGAAHGIKGEVRVKSFTDDPLALADYSPLYDRNGRAFEILGIRPQGEVVVVRLKGVTDRNAAEALNGTDLYVERAKLPAVDEGEFYHDDLVGLAVRDETGEAVGKVTSVQNYGAGDMLELSLGSRWGLLIPFTLAAVPKVSVSEGYVKIDTIAAGLVEDEDEEGNPDKGKDRGFDPNRRNRGPKDAGGNR